LGGAVGAGCVTVSLRSFSISLPTGDSPLGSTPPCHCGLWHPSVPRAPPPGDDRGYVPDSDWDGQTAFSDGPRELTYVPETDWDSQTALSDEPWEVTCSDADTFETTF
jgi:hypothetical protein